MLITLPFFDAFSRLGSLGRLFGFCLAAPYYVLLNSKIGDGKTLGKRVMHLQVVDASGSTISVGKSAVRYTLFAVAFFLNGIVFATTRTPLIVSILDSVAVFVLGGATIYLVLFNRNTRQGVHDLAVGSYLADGDKDGAMRKVAIWKGHWLILGLLVLGLGTGGVILGRKMMNWGPFPELLEDARAVEALDGVQAAGVQDLTWMGSRESGKKKILVVNVYWTRGRADEKAFVNQVATLILQHDPKINNHDLLRIVMTRGYDIAIAHAQISQSYEHSPAEWRDLLSGKDQPQK